MPNKAAGRIKGSEFVRLFSEYNICFPEREWANCKKRLSVNKF